jgi:Family of unknown function (DUF6516)
MFYNVVRDYPDIVAGYTVTEYRRYGSAMSFSARIDLIDGSVLFIKDYLFIDGKRKYSYHWQNKSGGLLSRWDNAPHHNHIITFPHHRHHQDEEVTSSAERNLLEIFHIIHKEILISQKIETL